MNDLLSLINRFQSLKDLTGTSKSSSYSVSIHFQPWSDVVEIELGGYDVPDFSRHEYINTTRENLLVDFEAKVVEAENSVVNFDWKGEE